MSERIVRVALVAGACIDGSVAILCLFFQPLLGPVLDVPARDPAVATFLGGESAVVAALYVLILRDLERYRPLLLLVALDQFFAAALPVIEIVRGQVAASPKTLVPIPISLLPGAVFVLGARATRTGAPS